MLVRRIPIDKEARLSALYGERVERAFRVSLGLLLFSGVLLAVSFVLAQVFSYLSPVFEGRSDLLESKPGTAGVYVSIVGFIACLVSLGYLVVAFRGLPGSSVAKRLSEHKRALVTLSAGLFLMGLYLFMWLFVCPFGIRA